MGLYALRPETLIKLTRFGRIIAALLITARVAHAEFAGFELGNGVALTNGVVQVNYNGDKTRTISLGSWFRVSLMEVRLTMVDGKVKRQTMCFAGNHAVRAPLPLELVEVRAHIKI